MFDFSEYTNTALYELLDEGVGYAESEAIYAELERRELNDLTIDFNATIALLQP